MQSMTLIGYAGQVTCWINEILAGILVARSLLALHRCHFPCDTRAFAIPAFLGCAFIVLSLSTQWWVSIHAPEVEKLLLVWQVFHCVSILGILVAVVNVEGAYHARRNPTAGCRCDSIPTR